MISLGVIAVEVHAVRAPRRLERRRSRATACRQRLEVPLLGIDVLAGVASRPCCRAAPRRASSGTRGVSTDLLLGEVDLALRAARGAARRCSRAACSSRRRTRAGACGREKFCASTCFCARSMALVTIPCSIGTPSSMPRRCIRPGDAVGPEDAHQVVFERQIEARRAGVALAAGAAAQLVVDAARLVALGAR